MEKCRPRGAWHKHPCFSLILSSKLPVAPSFDELQQESGGLGAPGAQSRADKGTREAAPRDIQVQSCNLRRSFPDGETGKGCFHLREQQVLRSYKMPGPLNCLFN